MDSAYRIQWRKVVRTGAMLAALSLGIGCDDASSEAESHSVPADASVDAWPADSREVASESSDHGGAESDGSANGDAVDAAVDSSLDAPPDASESGNSTLEGGGYGTPSQSCGVGLQCGGKDCCERSIIPGGLFPLGRAVAGEDACPSGMNCDPSEEPEHSATVEAFSLETYEVTVGRFRAFVEFFDGTPPPPGAGAHPLIPNSGWQEGWNGLLPKSKADLVAALKCHSLLATWTDTPGSQEPLPINCVDWFLAFAFCVWDGGRLPTEAEWEYAAAGGSENRLFPWGTVLPDNSFAVFNGQWGGTPGTAELNDIAPVGSVPSGGGRWGHQDLAGNVSEWVLDWFGSYGTSCDNCANIDAGSARVRRSGTWMAPATHLRAADRGFSTPGTRNAFSGLRCAGSP